MKMFFNKLILIIFLLTGITMAQAVYSNGTGGGWWSDPGTWVGEVVPTINDDVYIVPGDSVYTTSGASCNSLTVFQGGRFATSAAEGDTVQVVGLLTLENDAWFYNRVPGQNELPGSSYDLYDQSYVVHSGAGSVGGTNNFEFGNLIISRNQGVVAGANLIIHGNLIVNMYGATNYFRGCRSDDINYDHIVYGDVYVYRGTFSVIDGDVELGTFCSWNIYGDVYVIDSESPYLEARFGCFSSSNPTGTAVFNIGGDLVIQGGRLQAGTSSSPGIGTGIMNIGGDMSLDTNSAVATNHDGPFAINFFGTTPQTVNMDVRFQMGTSVYDTVKAGSNVVFDLDTNRWGSTVGGDFVVNGSLELKDESRLDGAGNFTLNPDAILKIGSLEGINTSGTTGNIQVTGTRTYDPGATYEYKGNSVQSLGDGLPNPVYGFGVNNPTGITLDRDLNINGVVNVITGDLELNNHIITLGPDAMLSETAGNTVKGEEGKITITTDLNAPSEVNVGGLGAWISSSANLGSTTIERYHSPRTGSGNEGIARYFYIEPANNSGLNADFRFYYDESELNGIPETNLRLFQSPDGSDGSWNKFWGSVNSNDNYVSRSGISEFSYWTLADYQYPLPVEESVELPIKFNLFQNFPNPFNPETKIRFDLPEASFVKLKVYSVTGEKIMTLVNDYLNAGVYYLTFNGEKFPSGIYLYKIETDKANITKKMMLLK